MATRLIINADDYGRSVGISGGIRQAHLHGIVTSTTALMNMPTIEEDLQIALQDTPRLGLGVHLVLTTGKPVLLPHQVSSLIDENGDFLKLEPFTNRHTDLDIAEIRAEWSAQVEKFISLSGRKPTHLDSHHHSSYFSEKFFRSMLELAAQHGCAIRLATEQRPNGSLIGLPPQLHDLIREFSPLLVAEFKPRTPLQFLATFYDELATKAGLLETIDELPEGTFEIMCHPGYLDKELADSIVYAHQRQVELSILTDPEVRRAIERRGIELVSFEEV